LISGRSGGPQTFLGPTLSIPYKVLPLSKDVSPVPGVYVVFPTHGDAMVRVHTQERHRSLFMVPVHEAELKFDATFDLTGVPSAALAGAELDWTRAGIVVGASNACSWCDCCQNMGRVGRLLTTPVQQSQRLHTFQDDIEKNQSQLALNQTGTKFT
jgi:inner membrane protein involved in colicin E2 resistance